ncbi:MAG: hypothetical protein ACREU6_11875 [Steroidobacteraceae bacterium]
MSILLHDAHGVVAQCASQYYTMRHPEYLNTERARLMTASAHRRSAVYTAGGSQITRQLKHPDIRNAMRSPVTTLFIALAAAAAMGPTSIKAQNKQTDRSDLRGVWISLQTSLEDPHWRIEDHACSYCALPALEHLRTLLNDPNSADRPIQEIVADVKAFNEKYVSGLLTHAALAYQAKFRPEQDDPILACKPVGLFTQAFGILPVKIEQYDDRVVIRYEYFGSVRTVYMDGRGHPADLKPSRLGHSIGWYDGDTLVVDTVGIEPNLIGDFIVAGMRTSGHARGIERYTRSKDGGSLDLEMTIIDPWTFRRPLLFPVHFLYAPKEKLQDFECTEAPEYSNAKSAPK